MTDRIRIEVLNNDLWQIEDTKTGEYVNPCDGTANVLKGLVKTINNLLKEKEEFEELKSKYSEQCIQIDFLKDENQHMRNLINENEQLKKKIKEDIVNKQYEELQRLKEENQQLKQFIKRISNDKGEIILYNGYGYNIKKLGVDMND